jgi:hypothetical protein
MQVLPGALKTCTRALETYMSSCTSRTDRLFFMLEARDLQGAVEHVAVPEPTSTGKRGPKL